jgi:chromosome segregation ATPase
MILEEAAGVSGLHSRRHEAELRLRAAETNLSRLEDVARELEATLGRLKREARQAERYKKISAEIRSLQGRRPLRPLERGPHRRRAASRRGRRRHPGCAGDRPGRSRRHHPRRPG